MKIKISNNPYSVMIGKIGVDAFSEKVKEQRKLAGGLLTWEASAYLAVHSFFDENPELIKHIHKDYIFDNSLP